MHRRTIALLAFAVLGVAACTERETGEATRSPSTTSPTTDGPSTTTPASEAVPGLSMRFEPDKRYTTDDVDLPPEYATDLGHDLYDDKRDQRIRGDLADYAHAVRGVNRQRADELAWTLQAVPFAVCVATERLDGGFEGFLARVEERRVAAKVLADSYGVPLTSDASPSSDPVLAFAVDEARRRFCPEHGEAVGDALGVLDNWDPTESGTIGIEDAAIPWWAFPDSKSDSHLSRFAVAAGYLSLATTPDLAGWALDEVMLSTVTCSEREETYALLAAPPRRETHAEDYRPTAEDVRGSLALSVAYLAVIELACPPDWIEH